MQPLQLTKKQVVIFNLLSEGLSRKEIAAQLNMTCGAIHQHAYRACRKNGICSIWMLSKRFATEPRHIIGRFTHLDATRKEISG